MSEKRGGVGARPPTRGWRAIAALVATVFALLLGEGLARLLLPPPQIIDVARNTGPVPPGPPGVRRHEAGERLPESVTLYVDTPAGKRLRPNVHARIRHHFMSGRDVTIRTNSLGFRGPELGAKSIPRALFLGDSITLGEWLNEEETFVFRVASLSSAAGRPVETINAGLAGASLEDELAILVESGLATSPDLVVLCFYLNDVWSSRRVRPIRPPRFLDRSALTWHLLDGLSRLPFRSSRDEYIDAGLEAEWREEIRSRLGEGPGDPRRDPKAFNRLVLSRVSDWGSAFSEKAWVRLDRLLSKLARQAKESRFRVLVAAFPVRIQVEADFLADFPQRRLQEVASRLGLPVLDLLPPLRKAFRESPEPLFFDHCHPTIRGQEAVAPLIEVEVARALAGRPAL